MTATEINIDGLVGLTHNYGGLSYGNVASATHAQTVSHPRQAALQGLGKMWFLHNLGIPQLVLPPHPRPHMQTLKQLGFASLDNVPNELLDQVYSSSFMWAANAATISPSADTADGKIHITPANLVSKFHRSIEPATTARYLRALFPSEHFMHHTPLPAHTDFADEGAANHMRLGTEYGERSSEVFVYRGKTEKYPARQTKAACEAIARQHKLEPEYTFFLQQQSAAIDAGVFHNDVIATSNAQLMLYHEHAFVQIPEVLRERYTLIKITQDELSLNDAVKTYFFNSQIVSLPNGGMAVIAPVECEENPKVKACWDRLLREEHITAVHYLDVRESMKNGGGPACLRLRIVLKEKEKKAVPQQFWLNETLYNRLCQWITNHYRDSISLETLRDPLLLTESQQALEELQNILHWPENLE